MTDHTHWNRGVDEQQVNERNEAVKSRINCKVKFHLFGPDSTQPYVPCVTKTITGTCDMYAMLAPPCLTVLRTATL